MRTVTWIMDSLLQDGLLTLVVVFQPEIRRALERMGQTDQWFLKFFRVRHVDPATRGSWRSAIIAICDAAERFSETKTGALIVLERRTDLSEIERTGTPGGLRGQPRSTGHPSSMRAPPCTTARPSSRMGASRPQGACCPCPTTGPGQGYGHPAPGLPRHRRKFGRHRHRGQRGDRIISMAKNGVLIRHFGPPDPVHSSGG